MEKTPSVNYIQAIEQELNEKEFRYEKKQHNDTTAFFVYLRGERSFLDVQLIIEENGNDVEIRCYPVKNTPQDRRTAILEAMNEFNNEHRYVSLSLNVYGDICAAYDFKIHTKDEKEAAVHCVKTIVLVANNIDNNDTMIMESVYGETDTGEEEESIEPGDAGVDVDGYDLLEKHYDLLQGYDDLFLSLLQDRQEFDEEFDEASQEYQEYDEPSQEYDDLFQEFFIFDDDNDDDNNAD